MMTGCDDMKKYEFTGETKGLQGVILKRIRALVDIDRYGVSAGDLGGWIEDDRNLTQNGDAWVSGDAWVYGAARVYGDACVYGAARVSGDARVYGDARVSGAACVYGAACVSGAACVYGDAWERSPLYIQGSRYAFYMASAHKVGVGCQIFSFAGWHKLWKTIATKFDFTSDEQKEYIGYFNLACDRYGKEEYKVEYTDDVPEDMEIEDAE